MNKYLNEQGFFNDAYVLEVAIVDENNVFQYMELRSMPVGTKPPEPFILNNPAKQLKKLKAGQVLQGQFDEALQFKWVIVDDLRGQEFYSKLTGEKVVIETVGPLSPDLTSKPCPDAETYDYVVDEKTGVESWVLNPVKFQAAMTAKNTAEKSKLMAYMSERITVLQDAVKFDIATAQEVVLLDEWMKYRVLLWRVDETASKIVWPVVPE